MGFYRPLNTFLTGLVGLEFSCYQFVIEGLSCLYFNCIYSCALNCILKLAIVICLSLLLDLFV